MIKMTGKIESIPLARGLILAGIIGLLLVVSGCSIVYHHYPFAEVRDIRAIETRLRQAVGCQIRPTKN